MEMVDALARVAAGIDHHAEAAIAYPSLVGSLIAGEHHMTEEGAVAFIGLPESGDMGAWYYQHVSGCLRVDVVECDNRIVLEDDISAHQALRQLAKDARIYVSLVIHWFLRYRLNASCGERYFFLPLSFFLPGGSFC